MQWVVQFLFIIATVTDTVSDSHSLSNSECHRSFLSPLLRLIMYETVMVCQTVSATGPFYHHYSVWYCMRQWWFVRQWVLQVLSITTTVADNVWDSDGLSDSECHRSFLSPLQWLILYETVMVCQTVSATVALCHHINDWHSIRVVCYTVGGTVPVYHYSGW